MAEPTIEIPAVLDEVTVSARKPVSTYNNLDNFKRQDFLKSSQFIFRLLRAPTIYDMDFRKFSLFCESVEFPGKSLDVVDYKIPGKNRIKVPYAKEFNEVTLTYIHNIEVPIYDFFSTWIDFISGANNSTENSYFDERVVDFNIIQYSEMPAASMKRLGGLSNILNAIDRLNSYVFDSSKLFRLTDIGQTFVNRLNAATYQAPDKSQYYNVKFYNAYPMTMASMPSTWADEGYHRLSITWAYEKYTINEDTKNQIPLEEVVVTGKRYGDSAPSFEDIFRNNVF